MISAAFCQWLVRHTLAFSVVICCSLSPVLGAELSIAVAKTPLSLPIFVADEQGFFRRMKAWMCNLHPIKGGHHGHAGGAGGPGGCRYPPLTRC